MSCPRPQALENRKSSLLRGRSTMLMVQQLSSKMDVASLVASTTFPLNSNLPATSEEPENRCQAQVPKIPTRIQVQIADSPSAPAVNRALLLKLRPRSSLLRPHRITHRRNQITHPRPHRARHAVRLHLHLHNQLDTLHERGNLHDSTMTRIMWSKLRRRQREVKNLKQRPLAQRRESSFESVGLVTYL